VCLQPTVRFCGRGKREFADLLGQPAACEEVCGLPGGRPCGGGGCAGGRAYSETGQKFDHGVSAVFGWASESLLP
jgi:hypothetical protein